MKAYISAYNGKSRNGMIIQGNSLDVLKTLDSESVDCCVTDPPYELGFMGKAWDSTGIAYNVELWREVLRVLKPGAHLLSFGGSRTYHRMACAIEDAGFEVRDMIEWVYGSGFPKSLNIGKAVDKLQGNKRDIIGMKRAGIAESPFGSPDESKKHIEDTKGFSEWEGWGTALKPSHEPICMARKPLSEKTVAENILKWGTGGINIDGCRVETEENITNHSRNAESAISKGKYGDSSAQGTHQTTGQQLGRFPANLIHDNSEEVRECFPETKHGGSTYNEGTNNNWLGSNKIKYVSTVKDSGNASRFFYCAKASKSERDAGCEGTTTSQGNRPNSQDPTGKFPDHDHRIRNGNHHPTIKPLALMKYLITLVCPPNGTVLDPFTGSGSTLIAAKKLGFNFIGIELNPEYVKMAERRIEGQCGGLF